MKFSVFIVDLEVELDTIASHVKRSEKYVDDLFQGFNKIFFAPYNFKMVK